MCVYIYTKSVYMLPRHICHIFMLLCACVNVYTYLYLCSCTQGMHLIWFVCVVWIFITSTLYIICHLSCIDLIIREKEHSYTLLIFFCADKYHYTQIFLRVFLISISHNCVYSDYLCYAFPQSSRLYTVNQFMKHNYWCAIRKKAQKNSKPWFLWKNHVCFP